MPRSRLSHGQRLEIARERQRGVAASVLATRFGVTRQTVHNAVRQFGDAPDVVNGRLRFLTVRTTDAAIACLDAAAKEHGLSRAEAARRLMAALGEVFAGGEEEAGRLRELSLALNRLGTNVNQIAKACNEARLNRQPIPYTAAHHEELRRVRAAAFAVADQVRALADGRRGQIDAVVLRALSGADAAQEAEGSM